jgi:NADH-quinone oxidoreductase subunit K
MVGLHHYLVLAAVLFTVGAAGVVLRRNVLTVLMSIELMLNAANLTFVAFARFPLAPGVGLEKAMAGHASAFFVIAVAAAEAAVGLAILIAVFRKRQTTHTDELVLLRDRDYGPDDLTAPAAKAPGEAH